ncbi:MAG: hypothetical protein M3R08_00835 [Bacteroidota bacterium]|nr:hypothetical protein [Bacteroidota bacterium]
MEDSSTLPPFNFTEAVQRSDTFRQLFPDEVEGMVIISLYERLNARRYENGYFSEEEIHRFFASFQGKDSSDGSYYPKARNKERIKRLLRFFLNYDEEKRLYSLQQYAYAFCDLSKNTLKGALTPTEIEVICRNLKEDLQAARGDDKALLNWFDISLDAYQTRLAQQTDFLHQQIDVAVRQLRKDVLDQNREPLDLLKQVSDDLADIQNKNQELRIAFEDTNKIVSLLIGIDTENEAVIVHIRNSQAFFSRIQGKLRSTDRRLDRIQPKIKQLFAILRQTEWTANTERFIHFLLQRSEVQGSGNEKKVLLPNGVSPFVFRGQRVRLLTFKREETLFPTPARPRKSYPVDEAFQEEARKQLREEIDKINRVAGWINQLMAQLAKDGQLDASRSFFEVMETDQNFVLASQVLFGLMDRVYLSTEYEVRISKHEIVAPLPSKNALWKTTIQKM